MQIQALLGPACPSDLASAAELVPSFAPIDFPDGLARLQALKEEDRARLGVQRAWQIWWTSCAADIADRWIAGFSGVARWTARPSMMRAKTRSPWCTFWLEVQSMLSTDMQVARRSERTPDSLHKLSFTRVGAKFSRKHSFHIIVMQLCRAEPNTPPVPVLALWNTSPRLRPSEIAATVRPHVFTLV